MPKQQLQPARDTRTAGHDRWFSPQAFVPPNAEVPETTAQLLQLHVERRLKSKTMTCAAHGAAALFLGLIAVKAASRFDVLTGSLRPWLDEWLSVSVVTVAIAAAAITALFAASVAGSVYHHRLNIGSKLAVLGAFIATGFYFRDRIQFFDYAGILLAALFAAIVIEGLTESVFASDPNSETIESQRTLGSALGLAAAAGALLMLFL